MYGFEHADVDGTESAMVYEMTGCCARSLELF
jgi:hypothetical protein